MRLTSSLIFFLSAIFSIAQRDITPYKMREAFIPTQKKEAPAAQIALPPDQRWFEQNTEFFDGYIIRTDGERLDGQIQFRRKWKGDNSYDKIEWFKVKNGEDVIDLQPSQVRYYSAKFKIKDVEKYMEGETFANGTINFNNGQKITGLVCPTDPYQRFNKKLYDGKSLYLYCHFAENENSSITTFNAKDISSVEYETKGKKYNFVYLSLVPYVFGEKWYYSHCLVNNELWVKELKENPTSLGVSEAKQGVVKYKNGSERKGLIGCKNWEYYVIDESGKLFRGSADWNDESISYQDGSRFILVDGNYTDQAKYLSTISDKKGKVIFQSGILITKAGKTLTGKFAQKNENEVYYLSNENNLCIYHSSQVDNYSVNIDGAEKKFLSGENGFYNTEELMTNLNSRKNPNPIFNLNSGTIDFNDGQKKTGKIAINNEQRADGRDEEVGYANFYFIDENKKIEKIFANDNKIKNIYIEIAGNTRAFARIYNQFIESVNYPNRFQYMKNPHPTNINKAWTGLAQSMQATVDNVVANTLPNAGGYKSEPNDQKGYWNEFIIYDTKVGKAEIMYRKNETDITKKLLGDCDKTRLIEQSIIKKNADIDNLDKLMSFLGQNACE